MQSPDVPPFIFDHVGIIVADVDRSTPAFARSLGASEATERFDDPLLGVSVRFVRDRSGMVYELIAPLGDQSPVAKALSTHTNLLNQIAYRTPSLPEASAYLRTHGAFPLGPQQPAKAFDGAKVQFLLSDLGYVIELIESPAHRHRFYPLTETATLSTSLRGASA